VKKANLNVIQRHCRSLLSRCLAGIRETVETLMMLPEKSVVLYPTESIKQLSNFQAQTLLGVYSGASKEKLYASAAGDPQKVAAIDKDYDTFNEMKDNDPGEFRFWMKVLLPEVGTKDYDSTVTEFCGLDSGKPVQSKRKSKQKMADKKLKQSKNDNRSPLGPGRPSRNTNEDDESKSEGQGHVLAKRSRETNEDDEAESRQCSGLAKNAKSTNEDDASESAQCAELSRASGNTAEEKTGDVGLYDCIVSFVLELYCPFGKSETDKFLAFLLEQNGKPSVCGWIAPFIRVIRMSHAGEDSAPELLVTFEDALLGRTQFRENVSALEKQGFSKTFAVFLTTFVAQVRNILVRGDDTEACQKCSEAVQTILGYFLVQRGLLRAPTMGERTVTEQLLSELDSALKTRKRKERHTSIINILKKYSFDITEYASLLSVTDSFSVDNCAVYPYMKFAISKAGCKWPVEAPRPLHKRNIKEATHFYYGCKMSIPALNDQSSEKGEAYEMGESRQRFREALQISEVDDLTELGRKVKTLLGIALPEKIVRFLI